VILLFIPRAAGGPHFFLWPRPHTPAPAHSPDGGALAALMAAAEDSAARVVTEARRSERVEGSAIPLAHALPVLAAMPADDLAVAPPSVAAWSLAAKLALDLAARERMAPVVEVTAAGARTRWGVSLALVEDGERFRKLVAAFPPSAHAVAVAGDGARIWAADALLLEFLDDVVDALAHGALARGGSREAKGRQADDVRDERADDADVPAAAAVDPAERWERRLARALLQLAADRVFLPAGVLERGLISELVQWAVPGRGSVASRSPRLCLKLEPPPDRTPWWRLAYLVQAGHDPGLVLPASDVWASADTERQWRDRLGGDPQEVLLRELARAARLFPPIEASLDTPRPEGIKLDTAGAWDFLVEASPALGEAGFGILLPDELAPFGSGRLRLRMHVGAAAAATGVVAGGGLGMNDILQYRWQAAVGDEEISTEEFQRLVAMKRPLVRWRGQWVALDPAEVAEVRKRLAEGGGRLNAGEALATALGGTLPRQGAGPVVDVVAEGPLASLLDRLRESAPTVSPPPDLEGELRPYQARGVGWLTTMSGLGLGACLADDMGLGKTIQAIALMLARRHSIPEDRRPSLIVCPMSVVGNWEREIARFAPTLPVVRHHGAGRPRARDAFDAAPPHAVVVTTYGMLRRDRALLGQIDWAVAVLDEAQNVKNPASQQAAAARALRATHRFALTGTPVENRLAELWSIFEFCLPGYLGPLEAFRRRYAVPIERYRDDEAAGRLRRLVRPFILRRLKSDPAVAADLPPKQEMSVVCTLTREQATLYRAAVEETMAKIERSEGIERRGQILALLTALKQICNHPAQYLHEPAPLAGRSGKLARLTEMLEETIAAGDRALVFTQFREMGDRLVAHLEETLGIETLFLHGGVPRAARDEMVRRFQEDPRAPAVFVLSLRAGGTGLNLTRATRVLHFDRWWNPAVEDQATDRAHRIGQAEVVQVYRLVAAGTLEDKIDRMLEDKRALADQVVGAGETWITELPDDELRQLVALSTDATIEEEAD
jgi:hypothetical protein